MPCEHQKTFTGIFVLVHFFFSLRRIDLRCVSKSTSICVETTLYPNERKPLKSVKDFIARMMGCTLGSIQHGGQVTQKDVLVSYKIGALMKEIMKMLVENPPKWLFRSKKIFRRKCPNFCIWPSIYLFNNALLFFFASLLFVFEKIEAKISKSRWMVCNEAKQKDMFT